MDVSELLNDLNKPQREAVAAPLGHTRILAGAGSGKTRVLVHRIDWLIQAEGFSPANIIAVTFTNKAAREMASRVGEITNLNPRWLDIGTFHGMCGRLLREHGSVLGLDSSFIIYDSADQLGLRVIASTPRSNSVRTLSPRCMTFVGSTTIMTSKA